MARNGKGFPKQARKVFEGDIFDVWQWEQELYDGSKTIFEGLDRTDTVQVICVLDDGKIMLVEDEQPHRDMVLTLSGGRMEVGEEPEETAKREVLEETGYEAGDLNLWFESNTSDKIKWTIYTFIGRGLKKVTKPNPDAGEKIKPILFSFEEFLELGKSDILRDKEIRIKLLEALVDEEKKKELWELLYSGYNN